MALWMRGRQSSKSATGHGISEARIGQRAQSLLQFLQQKRGGLPRRPQMKVGIGHVRTDPHSKDLAFLDRLNDPVARVESRAVRLGKPKVLQVVGVEGLASQVDEVPAARSLRAGGTDP
jgi:hypothetical protein